MFERNIFFFFVFGGGGGSVKGKPRTKSLFGWVPILGTSIRHGGHTYIIFMLIHPRPLTRALTVAVLISLAWVSHCVESEGVSSRMDMDTSH